MRNGQVGNNKRTRDQTEEEEEFMRGQRSDAQDTDFCTPEPRRRCAGKKRKKKKEREPVSSTVCTCIYVYVHVYTYMFIRIYMFCILLYVYAYVYPPVADRTMLYV
jgi:hypothetical protein